MSQLISQAPVPRCIEVWSEGKEEPDRYYDGYILLAIEGDNLRQLVVMASCSLPAKVGMVNHLSRLLGEMASRLGEYSTLEMGVAFLQEACQGCEERESCLLCKKLTDE